MPYGFFVEVDPGARPGHELPGGPPSAVDPGWGNRPPSGATLPEPPPGVWPPPSMGNPIVPVDPGFGGGIPVQPGTIWPSPGRPPHVDGGLPVAPGHPDAGLPTPPSGTLPARPPVRPDAGLPTPPAGTLPVKRLFWMLAYCPSLGWNFVCVDPSLSVGMPLPPTAAPK